jgi:predicted aminopeptidase
MKVLYDELSAIYGSNVGDSVKTVTKKAALQRFYDSLEINYNSIFQTALYRGLGKIPANNALLAVDMVYGRDLSLYYDLYQKNGKNIAKTCQAIVALKKVKGDAKKALKRMLP